MISSLKTTGDEKIPPPCGRLVLVLRGTAVLLLLAFVGAALPESWMKAVHEWGGLGPWPGGPLLVYLARAVSILYGFLGLVALYLSFNVRRYLPLIRFMAIASFPFVPVMFLVIWSRGSRSRKKLQSFPSKL
jgi:hypothetical protein